MCLPGQASLKVLQWRGHYQQRGSSKYQYMDIWPISPALCVLARFPDSIGGLLYALRVTALHLGERERKGKQPRSGRCMAEHHSRLHIHGSQQQPWRGGTHGARGPRLEALHAFYTTESRPGGGLHILQNSEHDYASY